MNRFLTRKKDKVPDNNVAAPEKPKKAKKGKKSQPEPEPVLDLACALPSTDDFRTSLIMPSLSTRFSMLREQDDPKSIIGKASDDSVLQPKRQSRLHEFGFIPGGLSDIAEVSSLHGSARLPFDFGRKDSNSSNNTEDLSGSMMSRARPGEGNVLFGGRQKIYKISNTGGSGRLLYEDDVSLSAFQRLRLEEKERRDREAQDGQNSEPSSPVADTEARSLLEYSKKRETTSSTNSGNANPRSSTAATSVSSQGANSVAASSPTVPNAPSVPTQSSELNRAGTKARRLYEQALDQQMQEQQSSAMNRLNSLQRSRAPTGRATPPLMSSQPRSANNLNDTFNRIGSLNGRDTQSKGSSPATSRAQSPGPFASPLGSDNDEALMLSSALQPNDRGKATAMGAFNKPKHAFNEQQYAERLKQLQQDRGTPAPRPGNPRKPSLRERAELARQRSNSGEKKGSTSPTQQRPPPLEKDATAGASSQAQEPSKVQQTPTAFSVFERAAAMMKAANPASPPPPKKPAPPPPTMRNAAPKHGTTFHDGSSDGEEESRKPEPPPGRPSESDRRPHNIPTASGPAPPILDHPALRSRSNTRTGDTDQPPFGPVPPIPSPPHDMRTPKISIPEPADKPTGDVDSPTLGPTNGGLSGLVRQHLRNISTVSSEFDSDNISNAPSAATTNPPSAHPLNLGHPSKAWDMDDLDRIDGESMDSTSPIEGHKPTTRAGLDGNILNTTQGVNQTIIEWEKEMKRTHKREPSLEERQAFHKELARRQRAIQESLRENAAQNRSRNPSPAPGGGLKTALNMLRAKSSKESFATTMEHKYSDANQALRVRGLGANSNNASSTSLAGPYGGDYWRSEERFGPREPPMRQKPTRILQQSEQDAQREMENRQRSGTNDSHGRAPRASTSSSSRGRSSSEVSNDRSRSRPRQYRDEHEHGEGSRGGYSANTTPPLPADRPSMESQGRMRGRSNSKTAASAYFESKHLGPIQTSHGNSSSPHLTPASNASLHHSPGMPSPNPNGHRSPNPPFSAHGTPPLSATSTPVAPAFSSGAAAIMPSSMSLRKKSINKADISDPIFLSTTSVVDTVNLPHGASMKNGFQESAPPVPAINPMRRRFGLGRSATEDPNGHNPYTDSMYTNSVDTLASKSSQPRGKLRKSSSEGRSLHTKSQVNLGPSPAMPSLPFGARNGSPPHPINTKPITQQNMDGAMF